MWILIIYKMIVKNYCKTWMLCDFLKSLALREDEEFKVIGILGERERENMWKISHRLITIETVKWAHVSLVYHSPTWVYMSSVITCKWKAVGLYFTATAAKIIKWSSTVQAVVRADFEMWRCVCKQELTKCSVYSCIWKYSVTAIISNHMSCSLGVSHRKEETLFHGKTQK